MSLNGIFGFFIFMRVANNDFVDYKRKLEKNITILVDGGAGFIGSNLCRFLLSQGYEVVAVDNLITGHIKNITPLFSNPRFHFFKLDITDDLFVSIFSNIQINQIYHLACPTGVPNIKIMGEEMLMTSSIGTRNVLEIARRNKAKLVFSSSAEVYGEPEKTPQTEKYSGNVHPLGPRSSYEEGKRFSETLVLLYAEKYNVEAKIVRIFNTYGPGMSLKDQRVLPQFIKSVINNEDLTIYGDGSQTRTFCYIDDLLNGLQIVMNKGLKGEAYNIGGEKQITIKDLSILTKQLTNYRNGTKFIPHFIEDHSHRQPSLERVKSLGWQAKISLEQGLRRMIAANNL